MRYRSLIVFRLGGWSPRLPTGFLVPRGTLVPPVHLSLRLQDCNPLWSRFPSVFDSTSTSLWWSATPGVRRPLVWPLPSSLAATGGIDVSFFSSGYLDVSVPRVPSSGTMYSFQGDGALPPPGFPIRISWDLCSLAAPPGFSQLATSFVGNQCLGHPPYALISLI